MSHAFRAFICVLLLAATAWAQNGQTTRSQVTVGGLTATVWASSELASQGPELSYAAKKAFDGNPKTAWGEGVHGSVIGQFLCIEFEKEVTVRGFILQPGQVKSGRDLTLNMVPTEISLETDGRPVGRYPVWYDKEMLWQKDEPSHCIPSPSPLNLSPRLIVFSRPVKGKTWKLMVTSAMHGRRDRNLFISEWRLVLEGREARIGLASYESVFKFLQDLGRGKLPLAEKTSVDDLVKKEHDSLMDQAPFPPEFRTYLQAVGAVREKPTPQAFMDVCRWEFIEAPVTVFKNDGRTCLIGSRSFTNGETKWVEFYPCLTLNLDYKITALSGLTYNDSLPGCRGVLPGTCGENKK